MFSILSSKPQLVTITLLFLKSVNGIDFISTPISEERSGSSTKKVVESLRGNTPPLVSIASLDTWMIEMLNLVNEERVKVGVSPLCYNQKLINAAQKHSNDMEEEDYFSHTGKDGSDPGDRIEEEGYGWKSYGENIAKGQKSVSGVMNAWMNSSGHKKNILSGSKTHFGAGWAKNERLWTLVFSSPRKTETSGCMSLSNPTQTPTINAPVSPPTKSPISSPTKSPIKCEDTSGIIKIKIKKENSKEKVVKKLKCKEVEKKNYCKKKTIDGKRAHKECPLSCGKCK